MFGIWARIARKVRSADSIVDYGNRVYRSILYNIKVLLKLPIRTNNNKLRTALVIPDIKIYL